MLDTGVPVDKILRTIIPGLLLLHIVQFYYCIVTFGGSYWTEYVGYHNEISPSYIAVNVVISMLVGTIVNMLSDVIVSNNYPHNENSKRKDIGHIIWKYLMFATHKKTIEDPRVGAIKQYISTSPRSPLFNKMITETYGHRINNDISIREIITMHQHLVTRSKLVSEDTKAYAENEFSLVTFIASITLVCVIGTILGIALLIYNFITPIEKIPESIVIACVIVPYFIAWFSNELLKRQFKRFANYIITLNINHYALKKNA